MTKMDIVLYWADLAQQELHCFEGDTVLKYMKAYDDAGTLYHQELEGRAGVVAYTVCPDFCGHKSLCELFMYIKPEHRGNPRNLLKMVKIMEDAAKEHGCEYVLIGSNVGYRDDRLLALLEKRGYIRDTVRKKIS